MESNSLTTIMVMLAASVCLADDFIPLEESLRDEILTNYTPGVRPYYKTNVTATLIPLSLNKLDIGQQVMSLTTVIGMSWDDPRLVWNPTKYKNIRYISVEAASIWTPDVVIENAASNIGLIGSVGNNVVKARVSFAGRVFWSVPVEATTSCSVSITKYPFDTQSCALRLTGWSDTMMQVNIHPDQPNLDYYAENGEWDLKTTWEEVGNFDDRNNGFVYRRIDFFFSFHRKWQFYGQNLVLPIVLMSVLMFTVFILPIESGEKMGFSLTVLLSYVVFLTWVTDNLPAISTNTSVLQVYLAIVLCLGVLITLLTTWVLHLYHRDPRTPMSATMRVFVVRVLVPCSSIASRMFCCQGGAIFRRNGVTSVDDVNGDERKHGDGDEPPREKRKPSNKNTVVQNIQNRKWVDGKFLEDNQFDSLTAVEDMGKEKRGGGSVRKASSPNAAENEVYTWQDVAAMFDRFFFLLFTLIKIITTSVILAVLYGNN